MRDLTSGRTAEKQSQKLGGVLPLVRRPSGLEVGHARAPAAEQHWQPQGGKRGTAVTKPPTKKRRTQVSGGRDHRAMLVYGGTFR